MSEMTLRIIKRICANHMGCNEPCEACWVKAKSILEDLREPTDAMIVAAYNDPSFVKDLSPTGTWQAMIDEAMK